MNLSIFYSSVLYQKLFLLQFELLNNKCGTNSIFQVCFIYKKNKIHKQFSDYDIITYTYVLNCLLERHYKIF